MTIQKSFQLKCHLQALEPGVYSLKPVCRPWHLDKAGNNRIRRFGFQLVPDFSGTAHSYVGFNLKAELADCSTWDTTPTRDQMLHNTVLGKFFTDTKFMFAKCLAALLFEVIV